MSGLIPITVNTPPGEEAHIRAEDDASIYQSIFGEDGVSTVGQACKATVLSNNKVRIADGIICVGGHFARIPYGDYIDCEIDSGQSEKKRNDIIVARFESTGTGGIDTYTCEVKKGTAGSTATDPEIVQEDLYKAGKVRELPLYRVKIEGLSITAVEQLFTLRKTNEELEKELAELNSKLKNAGLAICLAAHASALYIPTTDTININDYRCFVLQCCDSTGNRVLATDLIFPDQIAYGPAYEHTAVYAPEASNYIAYCYFGTDKKIYTKARSQYSSVRLYGIPKN